MEVSRKNRIVEQYRRSFYDTRSIKVISLKVFRWNVERGRNEKARALSKVGPKTGLGNEISFLFQRRLESGLPETSTPSLNPPRVRTTFGLFRDRCEILHRWIVREIYALKFKGTLMTFPIVLSLSLSLSNAPTFCRYVISLKNLITCSL